MYRPNEQDNGISLSRVLIAVGLSIAFFAAYAYFFPQKPHPKPNAQASQASIESKSDSTAPATQSQAAPTSAQDTQKIAVQDSQNSGKSLKKQIITTIESDEFEIDIDALGRIQQVYLKDKKFTAHEQKSLLAMIGEALGFKSAPKEERDKLPLFGDSELHTLELRFSDSALNRKAFESAYTTSATHIQIDNAPVELTLTQNLGELTITKHLRIYPNLHYEVRLELSKPAEYFISNGMRPTADHDTYAFRGVVARSSADGVLTRFEDTDATSDYIAKKAADIRHSSFVASVDRYYTSLFYTDEPQGLQVVISGDSAHNPMPYVRFEGNASFSGYIGAKVYRELEGISKQLTDVVEYGRITFFAKPLFLLLENLHDFCGNWGWAIVLLTLIVRVVLYPLTYKGMVSMQKLKDLAPKMKELQTRYKDEPQKLQMHMMDLYKKHGANPLGGCLPLILQIPVFFAIYRVLHNAVELKSAPWIAWIHDLSAIDPYFVLPVLMGITMYLSQKFTPSNFTDPMQEKIFRMLPLIFALFFIIFPFPAGLVLYWTINNIFSIIQQVSINKIMQKRKAREIEAHHHEAHKEPNKHKKG